MLLDLPGDGVGEPGRLRVLESAACDPERLYARILSGRYDKPFIVEDGRTRRLYFSLRFVLDGFDADGVCPAFLSRDFYAATGSRLRSSGLLVANFCGPPDAWHPHFGLLDTVFEGRIHLARVSDNDNVIAFAFADLGFPLDWVCLAERAAELTALVPLDFHRLLERLRDGADLRRKLRSKTGRAFDS